MHAGVSKTCDVRKNGDGPAVERSEGSYRPLGEEGHGIKPGTLEVEDGALGQHHVIPGIVTIEEH